MTTEDDKQPMLTTKKPIRRLYRSNDDRVIAGICGGLGEHLDMDPVIWRVIFIVLLMMAGLTFWIYIIMWLIVPLKR